MFTSPLVRFLLLYAGLFAAFGVASPFLPGLLAEHGLGAGGLSVVLAGGTAIRLLAGPLGGRWADRGRPAWVLAGLCAAAAAIALAYGPARGLWPLLLVSVAHAAVLAPLTPIADALALGSAQGGRGFDYGWVRGVGSAAFIAATLVSGVMVEREGLGVIVGLNAVLLACAAGLALLVPNRVAGAPAPSASPWVLLRLPAFRALMLVAALIGGSHALHDGFEVIRWRAAGLTASQSSLLWSESVAGEVLVFLLLGRPLLARLGSAGAMTLAAAAGIVRWGAVALTADIRVMAVVEPLHGLTFALMHLACMDVIARTVPARLAATAQAFYATIAMGAASAAVTLAAGPLYGAWGPPAFWLMAGLCAAALPLARRLRDPSVAGVSAS